MKGRGTISFLSIGFVIQLINLLSGCAPVSLVTVAVEPALSSRQIPATDATTPTPTATASPEATPEGEPTDEPLKCTDVPALSQTIEISDRFSEIALTLNDPGQEILIQSTLMDSAHDPIPIIESCVQNPGTVLLRASVQEPDVRLYLQEQVSRRIFVLDGIQLKRGKRINFGVVQGQPGASFAGTISPAAQVPMHGEIVELGWSFAIADDGTWSSGALPAGVWSVKINNSAGQTAQWMKMQIDKADVSLGAGKFAESEFEFAPLWAGSLTEPKASFLFTAHQRYVEMRMSLEPGFENTFWIPFRQIARVSIPTQGKHHVFAQLRTLEGEVSEVLVHELVSEGLSLSEQTDAALALQTVYVDNPTTTITTIPPPEATHHSVTVDIEELPRTWLPVSTPLPLGVLADLNSCGRHTVYIRFRKDNGPESPSLTRTFNVRCWEKDLPNSPLEPRFAHGAEGLNLSVAEGSDAVFIWGGRDSTQMFNNGAILKKVSGQWTWQVLPAAPSALTPRIRPKIIVGKNHVLVIGGEDLAGNAVSGWAFFSLTSNAWIDSTTFTSGGALTNAPPALKNSAVAYIDDLANRSNGAFYLAGGELNGQPKETTISGFVYYLIELNGSLNKVWRRYSLPKAVSRATFSRGSDPGFLFLHSGITTPSGSSADYSLSGSEFEMSSDLQVLYFYISGGYLYPSTAIYSATDSRTGALNGHSFLFTQINPPGSYASAEDFIKLQIMCVYGARKYTDEFPQACSGTIDGQVREHTKFCRRMYDSYFLAPTARLGICYRPKPGDIENEGSLENFYLSMQNSPSERILRPESSVKFNSANVNISNLNLFYWSGLSPTGGEYLSGGKIYYAKLDSWVPITDFEAPSPRVDHGSVFLGEYKRLLIWGGLTSSGPSSGGAFYAVF